MTKLLTKVAGLSRNRCISVSPLRRVVWLLLVLCLFPACCPSDAKPYSFGDTGTTQEPNPAVTLTPTATLVPTNPPGIRVRGMPDCPSDVGEPLFDTSPLREGDFHSILPLGGVSPPSHTFPTDHIYFFLRREDQSDPTGVPARVPVFAPADMWITSVGASEHVTADPPYTDYSIRFSPCRQFSAYFLHVQELAPGILDEIGQFGDQECSSYDTGGQTYRLCQKWDLEIKVQSGAQLGIAGGREGQNALDMGAHDARVVPLPYANPERLYTIDSGFDPFHVVCPIDYYEPEVRAELEAMLGYAEQRRTAEPVC